jgi:type VI secretion system protein ImpJ
MERPLFWHQGLFLQPQHFQLKDRYDQSLLTPVFKYLQPFFFGVGAMEIQTAALANRSVDIRRAELVFPDMTCAVVPDNAILQARSFEENWDPAGKGLAVYVGLRKWNRHGENVTVLDRLDNLSEVTTRFVTTASAEEVADLHLNGPSAQVKRMAYVLKLFWESEKEQLGDYELLPLAQLIKDKDQVMLSEKYIPPCVTIDGSPRLQSLVREIRDQVAARCHRLESYKRDRGIQTAEFGARDMVYLLALRSLNRFLPLLCHMVETGQVHPWNIYAVLRQLCGEFSSFSQEVDALGELNDGTRLLPAYDHMNLWDCFSKAQALVTGLLDKITEGPEHMLVLAFDGTYFGVDLPPAVFEGRNRFFLVLETEADPKALLSSLGHIAKLSSREALPILIARSLPGIKMDPLAAAPQELPRRANSLYFQIDRHSEQWSEVEKGKNLALYWDDAPDDLKVELMVVGRS